MDSVDLRMRFEWEAAEGVRAPELAATWARLEVTVGDHCVTQVEDARTGSSRRSVYVALYPLAEWVVQNWWFLLGHRRPVSPPFRAHQNLLGQGLGAHHYARHNTRAAGDGMAWPNLAIVPRGGLTLLAWRADDAPVGGRVRFLRTGEAWVPTEQVETVLASLVNAVTARLTERGVPDTPLAAEWAALRETSADERRFCLAGAALGVDPYRVETATAEAMIAVSEALGRRDAEDVFDAVRHDKLTEAVGWIRSSQTTLETIAPVDAGPLREVHVPIETVPGALGTPWHRGWDRARRVRCALGSSPAAALPIEDFFAFALRPAPDKRLAGLGGWRGEGVGLVLGQQLSDRAKRFAAARASWYAIGGPEEGHFMLTGAHAERQRVDRAFAAELLAPAAGIVEVLDGDVDGATDEDLESVANHYGVNSRVIEHQIANQVLA